MITPAAVVAETAVPEAAKVDGVVPIEHCSVAPVTTWLPMGAAGAGRSAGQEPVDRGANGVQDAVDRRGGGR